MQTKSLVTIEVRLRILMKMGKDDDNSENDAGDDNDISNKDNSDMNNNVTLS